MKREIIPVLTTDRAQYEQWYQRGLNAMTAAMTALRSQQRISDQLSWYPRFTVTCAAPNADQQVAAVQAALKTLRVMPNMVSLTATTVELTFELTQSTDDQYPVWQPTDGALWQLYDGLLNNLVGHAFQPVTAIQVTLSDYGTDQGTPVTLRPSFQAYGRRAGQSARLVLVPRTEVATPQPIVVGAPNAQSVVPFAPVHQR